MKNLNILFAVAQGSLLMAIMLNRYFIKDWLVLFFIIVFTTLSIIFNIIFLVRKGRDMISKSKMNDK